MLTMHNSPPPHKSRVFRQASLLRDGCSLCMQRGSETLEIRASDVRPGADRVGNPSEGPSQGWLAYTYTLHLGGRRGSFLFVSRRGLGKGRGRRRQVGRQDLGLTEYPGGEFFQEAG